MASNVDIESAEGGLIQLTLLSKSEKACLKFAKKIREGK